MDVFRRGAVTSEWTFESYVEANHLCRELLVMGILKKIDTAGSN